MQQYKVRFGYLEPDEIPVIDHPIRGPYPYLAAHIRHLQKLQDGGHIRNPVCFRYTDRLVCVDRPSRCWMARVAKVRLPVFISDYTDTYAHWPEIKTIDQALEYIEDGAEWGPVFGVSHFRYKAP